MSSTIEMNNIPIVIETPVDNITQAIVTAAKRTKPKVTVIREITIVDKIVQNIKEDKFSEDAVEILKLIFGREFCIVKGLETPTEAETIEMAVAVTSSENKEKKPRVKKPRTKKSVDVATETDSSIISASDPVAVTDSVVKVKKPRAKKAVTETTTVEVDAAAVPTEPKVKKPRAKKVITETTTVEVDGAVIPTEPKVKKPRAKKVVTETTSDVAADAVTEPKVEKPNTTKTNTSDTFVCDSDNETPSEPTKKPRTKKSIAQKVETTIQTGEVSLEEIQHNNVVKNEFSPRWDEELVEEELSDIEED